MSELILMLLLEKKAFEHADFYEYLREYYDIDEFNDRYRELLDDFLNRYALTKTEKSD